MPGSKVAALEALNYFVDEYDQTDLHSEYEIETKYLQIEQETENDE